MLKIEAIIPAAGRGERLRSKTPKALVAIQGVPIIVHTARALASHPAVSRIIVVARANDCARIRSVLARFKVKKIKTVVPGGKERFDSVALGLACVDKDTTLVMVHDGARPLVSEPVISDCIRQALAKGAAIAAVPVKATIKRAGLVKGRFVVTATLRRGELWEVQTPQVFRTSLIVSAYRAATKADVTDDACLVERMGCPVMISSGSYRNIKVTTPEDLVFARAMITGKK